MGACIILAGILIITGYITMGLPGGIILQLFRPLFVYVLYPDSKKLYDGDTLWAAAVVYSMIWPLLIPAGCFLAKFLNGHLGKTAGTVLTIGIIILLAIGIGYVVIRKNIT
jgi:hypothetical protein